MIYLGRFKQKVIDSVTKKLIKERDSHFIVQETKASPPIYEQYKDWIISYNNTWIPTEVNAIEEKPQNIPYMSEEEANKFIKKFNTVERMKSVAKKWYLSLTKI